MKPCTRFNLIHSNIKENPVEQNLLTKEFTIKLDENCVASVKYEIVDNDIYDLVHSSIPEQCQGLGLGHILAEVLALFFLHGADQCYTYKKSRRTQSCQNSKMTTAVGIDGVLFVNNPVEIKAWGVSLM